MINQTDNLSSNLRQLMKINNLSEAELARKTNIPQPTIHKILAGKTSDPRASTLKALANFFNVQIDMLLSNDVLKESDFITKTNPNRTQSIPIISWKDCINFKKLINELTPTNWQKWAITEFFSYSAYALMSKPSMEPRFPKGSTLIIDPSVTPEDGDFVVAFFPNTREAALRELSIDGPTKILTSMSKEHVTNLEDGIKIFGVVVKSVFSFHN